MDGMEALDGITHTAAGDLVLDIVIGIAHIIITGDTLITITTMQDIHIMATIQITSTEYDLHAKYILTGYQITDKFYLLLNQRDHQTPVI